MAKLIWVASIFAVAPDQSNTYLVEYGIAQAVTALIEDHGLPEAEVYEGVVKGLQSLTNIQVPQIQQSTPQAPSHKTPWKLKYFSGLSNALVHFVNAGAGRFGTRRVTNVRLQDRMVVGSLSSRPGSSRAAA